MKQNFKLDFYRAVSTSIKAAGVGRYNTKILVHNYVKRSMF